MHVGIRREPGYSDTLDALGEVGGYVCMCIRVLSDSPFGPASLNSNTLNTLERLVRSLGSRSRKLPGV